MAHNFLGELSWRGLLHQATHPDDLATHLSSAPRRIYAGFDPTADSLTLGNLVPLLLLRHAQRAGHTPVVLMGGATGLIGDPSGKSSERQLLSREQIDAHIQGQRRVFTQFLDFSGPNAARMVNNADWLLSMGYVDMLRDVGKHFSVNTMIQRDSVRDRLHQREQGISYTEFSYMVLQAYDFYHLARHEGVTVQMGGSDQYGNIVSGCDLIRRLLPGVAAFGVTAPLLLKADGSKFGKSEQGALWLTADRTSPYQLYQYLVNTEDAEVLALLSKLTFFSHGEINALQDQLMQDPAQRAPQRALARAVVDLIHGSTAAQRAEHATQALFSGDIRSLSAQEIKEIFAHVFSTRFPRELLDPPALSVVDLLLKTSLVTSKREARELLQARALWLNGQVVISDLPITRDLLLYDQLLAIRKGKKTWHLVVFST